MTDDLTLLRRAIAIADAARAHGNHPFGALLTDAGGEIVLESQNAVVTTRDCTAHAETGLVRLASTTIARDELAGHTLYTSCEPCAMCSGAIYWAGIGRVVYALSEQGLLGLTGSNPENPTLAHPCRLVFAAGQRHTEVSGPHLENEAAASHRGFWN